MRRSYMSIYRELKEKLSEIVEKNGLSGEEITIDSKTLSSEEAIGITDRKDFPILTGKEVMLEAEFRGAKGQSFTSSPAVYRGTLSDIMDLDIENDQHAMGLFIASLNAIMRYLELIDGTVHCKNEEPEKCGKKFAEYVKSEYGDPKIALIGYQPAILENLSKQFSVRVLDLDPKNVGSERYGVLVEDGVESYDEVVMDWADIVLCTGSTLANGSIVNFIDIGKPVIFFGTTIAGAAEILGLERACFYPA
jgi:uncharacterized protein (DUF4213/DUF364 family)